MILMTVDDLIEELKEFAKEDGLTYEEELLKFFKEFAEINNTEFHYLYLNEYDNYYLSNNMINELTKINIESLKRHYKNEYKVNELSKNNGILSGRSIDITPIINLEKSNIKRIINTRGGKDIIFNDKNIKVLSNGFQNLLSLEGVIRLFEFMENTDSAINFNNYILKILKDYQILKGTLDVLTGVNSESKTITELINEDLMKCLYNIKEELGSQGKPNAFITNLTAAQLNEFLTEEVGILQKGVYWQDPLNGKDYEGQMFTEEWKYMESSMGANYRRNGGTQDKNYKWSQYGRYVLEEPLEMKYLRNDNNYIKSKKEWNEIVVKRSKM